MEWDFIIIPGEFSFSILVMTNCHGEQRRESFQAIFFVLFFSRRKLKIFLRFFVFQSRNTWMFFFLTPQNRFYRLQAFHNEEWRARGSHKHKSFVLARQRREIIKKKFTTTKKPSLVMWAEQWKNQLDAFLISKWFLWVLLADLCCLCLQLNKIFRRPQLSTFLCNQNENCYGMEKCPHSQNGRQRESSVAWLFNAAEWFKFFPTMNNTTRDTKLEYKKRKFYVSK